MDKIPSSSLTVSFGGRVLVLSSDIEISEAWDPSSNTTAPQMHKFKAIWDTGATNTVINQSVADRVGLRPTGKTTTSTVNGQRLADTFLVNVRLPNGVGFKGLRVTEGTVTGGEVLIGMDIIGTGDFSVTCADGITCMSFRVPSIKKIDYVAEHDKNQPKVRNRMKKNRNKMPWDRR